MFSNYTTTNLVNGKIYCGVHNESSPSDYLGSGVAIQHAIKKYSKENFVRVIDHLWEDEEAAYCLESLIVDQEFLDRNNTYNMKPGGYGGSLPGLKHTDEFKAKMSAVHKGKIVSNETKAKMSVSQQGKIVSNEAKAKMSASKVGKKRKLFTVETKAKISKSIKAHWIKRKLNKELKQ